MLAQGLKVRTDLGAPKQGPPPLLRVAGAQRPSLPPMPRLKLGNMRSNGPTRYPVTSQQQMQLNGMMNMMRQPISPGSLLSQHQGHLVSPPMNQLANMMQQNQMGLNIMSN